MTVGDRWKVEVGRRQRRVASVLSWAQPGDITCGFALPYSASLRGAAGAEPIACLAATEDSNVPGVGKRRRGNAWTRAIANNRDFMIKHKREVFVKIINSNLALPLSLFLPLSAVERLYFLFLVARMTLAATTPRTATAPPAMAMPM